MNKLSIVISLLLVGCAKVSDYQASCEQIYPKLSEMANCLDFSVKNDSRMASSSTPKLYILAAKMLGQLVDQEKISDAQARLELQNLYVNIERQEAADHQAQGAAIQQALLGYQAMSTMQAIENKANRPEIYYPPVTPHGNVSTNCYRMGNNVQCNSSY